MAQNAFSYSIILMCHTLVTLTCCDGEFRLLWTGRPAGKVADRVSRKSEPGSGASRPLAGEGNVRWLSRLSVGKHQLPVILDAVGDNDIESALAQICHIAIRDDIMRSAP